MSRYFYDDAWKDRFTEADYYQSLVNHVNNLFTWTEGEKTMKKSLIERLRQERSELEEKIEKIKKFNNSENFEYLDKEDRDLLIAQENAMVTYHQILQMRIKKRNKEY